MLKKNIIMMMPIAPACDADRLWDKACKVKDILWAKSKTVLQLPPKPTDGGNHAGDALMFKVALNELMMADAAIVLSGYEMASDVQARMQVAKHLRIPVIIWSGDAESVCQQLAEL